MMKVLGTHILNLILILNNKSKSLNLEKYAIYCKTDSIQFYFLILSNTDKTVCSVIKNGACDVPKQNYEDIWVLICYSLDFHFPLNAILAASLLC